MADRPWIGPPDVQERVRLATARREIADRMDERGFHGAAARERRWAEDGFIAAGELFMR